MLCDFRWHVKKKKKKKEAKREIKKEGREQRVW